MSVSFLELDEFRKDLKKIKINIEKDLNRFFDAVEMDFDDFDILRQTLDLKQISGLEKKKVTAKIFKARKFRCKALGKGSKSGIRVIFMVSETTRTIELIEIYQKNRKPNHDEKRIIQHYRDN